MPANRTDNWIEIARARMAAKGKVKPATKAGAVRALWPAIQAAIENGQTLKSIRDWLAQEGVELTYNQLTSYVGRIRRRDERSRSAPPQAGKSAVDSTLATGRVGSDSKALVHNPTSADRGDDPLANVRAREQKRPTFEYSPEFNEDELI
jgi:hypothetical protein